MRQRSRGACGRVLCRGLRLRCSLVAQRLAAGGAAAEVCRRRVQHLLAIPAETSRICSRPFGVQYIILHAVFTCALPSAACRGHSALCMQLSSAYKAQEFAISTPVGAVIGEADRLLPSRGLLQLQPLCRLWQRRQWRAAVATVAETAACRSVRVKNTCKGRNFFQEQATIWFDLYSQHFRYCTSRQNGIET